MNNAGFHNNNYAIFRPSPSIPQTQEKTPTWKIVTAVAIAVIVIVALVLLLASPLVPVILPLAIGLTLFIGAEIGLAIAALGIGIIALHKNYINCSENKEEEEGNADTFKILDVPTSDEEDDVKWCTLDFGLISLAGAREISSNEERGIQLYAKNQGDKQEIAC